MFTSWVQLTLEITVQHCRNMLHGATCHMLHGHTLKSATCDYDQRHVIAFRPISIAARSWSYDNSRCCNLTVTVSFRVQLTTRQTLAIQLEYVMLCEANRIMLYVGMIIKRLCIGSLYFESVTTTTDVFCHILLVYRGGVECICHCDCK